MFYTAMVQALQRVGLIKTQGDRAAKELPDSVCSASEAADVEILDAGFSSSATSLSNTLTIIRPNSTEAKKDTNRTANSELLEKFRKGDPPSKSRAKKNSKPVQTRSKTPAYRGPLLKNTPLKHPTEAISNNRTEIFVNDDTSLKLSKLDSEIPPPLLLLPDHGDLQPNLSEVDTDDISELVIGLDFGTSSTKVVIHDRVRGLWFAVPFYAATGLNSYLLRARVYQSDRGDFSLASGALIYRDLKLSFLKEDTGENAIETVAFLALAFKRIRAWLLQQHPTLYQNTNILWSINIGIPSTEIESEQSKSKFLYLAQRAWYASLTRQSISRSFCALPLSKLQELAVGEYETPEFHATTEVTAQVVAFFESDQFDPKAKNTYMIVDIGAGTVDTCLFSVRKGNRGDYTIDFHANTVRQNGIVNLHRFRLNWITNKIFSNSQTASQIRSEIKLSESYTDMVSGVPATFSEYLENAYLHINKCDLDPDQDFSRHRLKRQTISDTLYLPVKNGWVAQESAERLPVFFCGGGSRHPLYRNLANEMREQEGISWLSTTKRELVKPEKLTAPGLLKQDFDRLSVAYGLSTSFRIGEFKKAQFGGGMRTLRKRDLDVSFTGKEVC